MTKSSCQGLMNQYFERMKVIRSRPGLPMRIRFMLEDVAVLREKKVRKSCLKKNLAVSKSNTFPFYTRRTRLVIFFAVRYITSINDLRIRSPFPYNSLGLIDDAKAFSKHKMFEQLHFLPLFIHVFFSGSFTPQLTLLLFRRRLRR